MAHQEQFDFVNSVKQKFTNNFINAKVLEVGSLNLNGTVRQSFENCEYIGLDLGEGPAVDVVCEGQNYDAPDNHFDTTISCECFEHNPYWVETFKNMIRMTKSGGLVVMTCATTSRAEHGTARTSPEASPLSVGKGWDYYMNLTQEDFESNIDLSNSFSSYEFSTVNQDLYLWGIKR
jgi:SAM-dependent methyltransferase